MNNLAQIKPIDIKAIESVLIRGDLSGLTAEQKVNYNKSVCESLGLNHLTKPFEYIKLNGKEVLYATKGCAEQLRSVHGISIEEVHTQKIEDVFVVTAKAKGKDGRVDSSTGAVAIGTLKGEALANALMKAETKAKRRVTLSICGLNMLDETEVETIQEARPASSPLPEEELGAEQLSHDPGFWEFPFGKYKGQSLKDIQPNELDNYLEYLRKSGSTNIQVKDAIEFGETYLKSREFAR